VQGSFASQQAVTILVRRRTESDKIDDLTHGSFSTDNHPTPGEYTPDVVPGTPSFPTAGPSAASLHQKISALSVPTSAVNLPEGSVSPESKDEWELVEIGKGLSHYNSWEIDKVKGLKSSQIEEILGYADSEHVVGNITLRVLA